MMRGDSSRMKAAREVRHPMSYSNRELAMNCGTSDSSDSGNYFTSQASYSKRFGTGASYSRSFKDPLRQDTSRDSTYSKRGLKNSRSCRRCQNTRNENMGELEEDNMQEEREAMENEENEMEGSAEFSSVSSHMTVTNYEDNEEINENLNEIGDENDSECEDDVSGIGKKKQGKQQRETNDKIGSRKSNRSVEETKEDGEETGNNDSHGGEWEMELSYNSYPSYYVGKELKDEVPNFNDRLNTEFQMPQIKSTTIAVQTEDILETSFEKIQNHKKATKHRQPKVTMGQNPSRDEKRRTKSRRYEVILPDRLKSTSSGRHRLIPKISVKPLRVFAVSPENVRVKGKLQRPKRRPRTAMKRVAKEKMSKMYRIDFVNSQYATPREKKVTKYLLSSNDSLPFLNNRKKKKEDFFMSRFEKEWAQEMEIKRRAQRERSKYKV